MNLVGLCGDIGAGKDTVAEYLVEHHYFVRVSFATTLKQVARLVFNLEYRHVHGTQADKDEPISWVTDAAGEPRTGRGILEMLGTEGFRDVDPAVWIKCAMRDVERAHAVESLSVVIPDVRFSNEFKALRERGGLIWEVVRVGGPPCTRSMHQSNQQWRDLPKDNRIVARHGDMRAIADAVDIALHEGSLIVK